MKQHFGQMFLGACIVIAALIFTHPPRRELKTEPYELWRGQFCDYLLNKQTGAVWRYYRNTNPTNEEQIIGEGFEYLWPPIPVRHQRQLTPGWRAPTPADAVGTPLPVLHER
ncbi:MAG: hypothetical protein KGR98_06975 [Verrucomicrobia bacterium]|nr:hypothetical protein [Verrucomicrobiota bacterium]MDE3098661.1 hypothetical protein [Verrucomicrobiota bacterium]